MSYHHTMFVRFRRRGHRVTVSLLQSRRVAGETRSEHVAALGAVDVGLSARERIAFWRQIEHRLNRLDNRISTDDREGIIAALAAKIPLLTPDDLKIVQIENAQHDEKFWGDVRDTNADRVERHRRVIATAEKEIASCTAGSEEVAERIDVAKDRLARIERGEPVVGGLGAKLDIGKVLMDAGITPSDKRHIMEVASLTPEEFESLSPMMVATIQQASRRAVRKILRERK